MVNTLFYRQRQISCLNVGWLRMVLWWEGLFACPSCVYCRGHPLPSVSSNISTGSHQPPHPLPWLPILLPMSFSECHITQQCVYSHSVFLLQAFIADVKTKAFDSSDPFEQGSTAVSFFGSYEAFCNLFLCCKVGYRSRHLLLVPRSEPLK